MCDLLWFSPCGTVSAGCVIGMGLIPVVAEPAGCVIGMGFDPCGTVPAEGVIGVGSIPLVQCLLDV